MKHSKEWEKKKGKKDAIVVLCNIPRSTCWSSYSSVAFIGNVLENSSDRFNLSDFHASAFKLYDFLAKHYKAIKWELFNLWCRRITTTTKKFREKEKEKKSRYKTNAEWPWRAKHSRNNCYVKSNHLSMNRAFEWKCHSLNHQKWFICVWCFEWLS